MSIDAPAAQTRTRQTAPFMLPALSGGALLCAYFVLRALSPLAGEAEFAYAPVDPGFHWFAPMRGFTVEALRDHVLRFAVLGPALLLLSLALSRAPIRWDLTALWTRRLHVPAGIFSLLCTAFAMLGVLRGRPIIDDEATYANMARTLSHGHLTESPIPGLGGVLFDIVTPLGRTGKYLPGEPLIQVLGVLVGIPALLHLPLNALTLIAFHRAALLLSSDARIASWTTVFLALSPMFILCAATGLSQASALACVALAVLGYAMAAKRALVRGGALAGCAVAFGLLVRPQALPIVGLVLALAFTHLAVRRRVVGAWLAYACTSILGVAAIAGYDYVLSGGKLEFPFWFMRSTEQWGSIPFLDGPYRHTLRGALLNQVVVAVRMNAWWLGWPFSLLLVFMPTGWRGLWRHAAVLSATAVAIVLFQLGYYTTGVWDVGPIYHFELLLTLSVLAAYYVIGLSERKPKLAAAAVAVHLLLGTGTFLAEQTSRLHRVTEMIHAESDRVLASLPRPSLLLTETQCGEILTHGWMIRGYPREVRDPRAPVIIHFRPEPSQLDALLAQFPERACFYAHGIPAEHRLEVLPCAEARSLMMRPLLWGACAFPLSTATQRGWYQGVGI